MAVNCGSDGGLVQVVVPWQMELPWDSFRHGKFKSRGLRTDLLPSNHYWVVKMVKTDGDRVIFSIRFINNNAKLFGYPEVFVAVINIWLITGGGQDRRRNLLIGDQQATFVPNRSWKGYGHLQDKDIRAGRQAILLHLRFPKPEIYRMTDPPNYRKQYNLANKCLSGFRDCDVMLKLGDHMWKERSSILASHSPVFKAALEKKMEKGEPMVTIQLEHSCDGQTFSVGGQWLIIR